MSECKISVIIPAFNASSTIKDCVKSLKEQDFNDFEIIVVDDNSKDNTYNLVKNLCKVVKNYGKKGAGSARNSGARVATSNILAFIDSDCIAPKDWLKKIYDTFKEKKIKIIAGGYDNPFKSTINKFNYYEQKYRQRKLNKYSHNFSSNNVTIRKHIFLSSGGFPEYIKGAGWEDMELSSSLSRKCSVVWKKYINVIHINMGIKKYLKSQLVSAAGTFFLILKKKPILFKKTTENESYPEAFLFSLFILSLIVGLFNKYLLLISLILFLMILTINLFFIHYLIKDKNNVLFILKSIFLIFLRDIIWFIGIFQGLKYFIEYKITKKVRV